jgi:periplasmic divalent cation tolerance protein
MIEIWINCPDKGVADEISDALIDARLAACTNCFAEIESHFRWQGSIEEECEVPLVVKTREELFEDVVEAVKNKHPYDIPSIVGMPVEFVNADYVAWVYEETIDP